MLLRKNLDQIKDRLRIQIFCGTRDDTHLPSVRDFHRVLIEAGVDHTYLEIAGVAHSMPLERYKTIWFDHHVSALKLAAEEAAKPR